MGSKKSKPASKKFLKALADSSAKSAKSAEKAPKAALKVKPPKKAKPPADSKFRKELKRIFGKKLKPGFQDLGDEFVFNFGNKKISRDDQRIGLFSLLAKFPDAPAA